MSPKNVTSAQVIWALQSTFDDQLKKTGTGPIRDFETTEFWVEKTIVVGKEKVLVGKLYEPALSKVIEPKSFALADEWTCK